jgi:hypothetical protein
MRMDTRIPMMGQPVNALAKFGQGIQMAGMANQIGDNNRLRDVFATQGPGVMAGDPGALDALATAGPAGAEMALGVQQQRQNMEIDRERLALARQTAAQSAAEFAMTLGDRERQQVLGALTREFPRLATAFQEGNMEAFNSIIAQYPQLGLGAAETPEQARLTLEVIAGMGEAFEGVMSNSGLRGGENTIRTTNIDGVFYQFDETDPQGTLTPLTEPRERGPDTVVQVSTGENADRYAEGMTDDAVERHGAILTAASEAGEFVGDLQMLAQLGTQLETGPAAVLMEQLGPFAQALGIEVEGLGPAQAYASIVSRLAPRMRVPGSGASSDFEGRQFLQSLPSLARTPEGNAIINETLQAIQRHRIEAAEIIRRGMAAGTPWLEVDREIAALGNPYEAFNSYRGASGSSPPSPGSGVGAARITGGTADDPLGLFQ